jgi:hypothetical protein
MIDFYLDEHTHYCSLHRDWDNISHALLFIKNKYLLVRYNSCQNQFGHLDYKQDLVKRIISDNKIFPLYEVEREKYSYNDFCIYGKLTLPIKKTAKQVNYIYFDNAGKQYAITTKTDFFDEIFAQQDRNESFLEAKDYLENNCLDYLVKDLKRLHDANSINSITESTCVKTMDELLKTINQLIK